MIALDTSALVAMASGEPEAELFSDLIAQHRALVGTPTLFETHMVLSKMLSRGAAEEFIKALMARPTLKPVAFWMQMHYVAADAFERYGRGRGHPAKLNFGDCMTYAVAKFHTAPLLFKGKDFSRTDLEVVSW